MFIFVVFADLEVFKMPQSILPTKESKTSKPSQKEGLHALLTWIENKETRKSMCYLSQITNQALGKKLSRLKANGLIKEIQNKPCCIYELTSFGRQINSYITQPDYGTSKHKLWRIHNLILGFRIETWGSWQFNETLTKQMRGWNYQELFIKAHKIHIQETNLLKIYIPEQYDNDPERAKARMYEEGQKIANHVAQLHHMKLKPMHIIREAHKELQGSDKLARLLGSQKLGNVWIDESEKDTPSLEEAGNEYSLEALLEMPQTLKEIQQGQVLFADSLKLYNEQIKEHLAAIKDIRDSIAELRDVMRGIRNVNNNTEKTI